MSHDILRDPPPPEGYGSAKSVKLGKSRKNGEVYHFVRRGRRVLFRGTEEECEAFIKAGLKSPLKVAKKFTSKKKVEAKK